MSPTAARRPARSDGRCLGARGFSRLLLNGFCSRGGGRSYPAKAWSSVCIASKNYDGRGKPAQEEMPRGKPPALGSRPSWRPRRPEAPQNPPQETAASAAEKKNTMFPFLLYTFWSICTKSIKTLLTLKFMTAHKYAVLSSMFANDGLSFDRSGKKKKKSHECFCRAGGGGDGARPGAHVGTGVQGAGNAAVPSGSPGRPPAARTPAPGRPPGPAPPVPSCHPPSQQTLPRRPPWRRRQPPGGEPDRHRVSGAWGHGARSPRPPLPPALLPRRTRPRGNPWGTRDRRVHGAESGLAAAGGRG